MARDVVLQNHPTLLRELVGVHETDSRTSTILSKVSRLDLVTRKLVRVIYKSTMAATVISICIDNPPSVTVCQPPTSYSTHTSALPRHIVFSLQLPSCVTSSTLHRMLAEVTAGPIVSASPNSGNSIHIKGIH